MDINYFGDADTSPLHDLYLSLECSSSLANYSWPWGDQLPKLNRPV